MRTPAWTEDRWQQFQRDRDVFSTIQNRRIRGILILNNTERFLVWMRTQTETHYPFWEDMMYLALHWSCYSSWLLKLQQFLQQRLSYLWATLQSRRAGADKSIWLRLMGSQVESLLMTNYNAPQFLRVFNWLIVWRLKQVLEVQWVWKQQLLEEPRGSKSGVGGGSAMGWGHGTQLCTANAVFGEKMSHILNPVHTMIIGMQQLHAWIMQSLQTINTNQTDYKQIQQWTRHYNPANPTPKLL